MATAELTEVSDEQRFAEPSNASAELRDFWDAFDVHRLQIRMLLREVLATEKHGLPVLAMIVPDPVSPTGPEIAKLQRRAWVDREWAPLNEYLRDMIERLIEQGLVWADWARLSRAMRVILLRRICDAYAADPARRTSGILGMAAALDHITAHIGDALTKAPSTEKGAPVPDIGDEGATGAEQTIGLAIDAAPIPMLAITEDGVIAVTNRQLETAFGYTRGELVGQHVEVLLPQAARERHVKLRTRFAAMPSARPMAGGKQIKGVRKNGTEIPIEVGLAPYAAQGETLVLATVFQVSEDRQAAAKLRRTLSELERSNEELEQFAYVASHDLQEPLRMVASYTELLRRGYAGKLDEEADRFINFAVEGAQRLSRVVSDLLTYSRVGGSAGSFVPTDTDQLVDGVIADLALSLEEAGAEVSVQGRLPTIVADSSQLRLVFQNLIGNAIKFARKDVPPRIQLSAERTGEHWQFSVNDNGQGIDPRFAERIFVLFHRLHAREDYEGSGIGLTIARRVVERHGGRIWVESTPGEGSSFRFALPLWPVTTG